MSNKKILIVDDDKDIRENLEEALKYEGYDIITAVNGRNALDILLKLNKDELPGLILLDLMMPIMAGQEFLKNLDEKYQSELGHIPVIVISAQVDQYGWRTSDDQKRL